MNSQLLFYGSFVSRRGNFSPVFPLVHSFTFFGNRGEKEMRLGSAVAKENGRLGPRRAKFRGRNRPNTLGKITRIKNLLKSSSPTFPFLSNLGADTKKRGSSKNAREQLPAPLFPIGTKSRSRKDEIRPRDSAGGCFALNGFAWGGKSKLLFLILA